MDSCERRRHRRLPIALVALCRDSSPPVAKSSQARTVNASTGGLYIETSACTLRAGDLVEIEMSIPPTTGVLESGGAISGRARVLRIDAVTGSDEGNGPSLGSCGVAVEFCQRPKLRM
ncbi:MAG: PilZ domain-containing protein [Phycisphaerales bacterium]|nr:MAG: PilZ domain-containing protein [Phycisphaerales bacterium]